MMNNPQCPVCDHVFGAPENNFEGALGKRTPKPCPECSTVLTWHAKWFGVYRASCWMFMTFTVLMTIRLFGVRYPAAVWYIAMTCLWGGLVGFVMSGLLGRLVIHDQP